MEKDYGLGYMEIHIKGNGKKVIQMDTEYIWINKKIYMKDNLSLR